MVRFSLISIGSLRLLLYNKSPPREHMLSDGSINMLGGAEGNRFFLWCNYFSYVVLTRIRIILWQGTFIFGSNTIHFSFGRNKFPFGLEVFKGSNHRNQSLSGFRKSFSIYSNINSFLLTELCSKRRQNTSEFLEVFCRAVLKRVSINGRKPRTRKLSKG